MNNICNLRCPCCRSSSVSEYLSLHTNRELNSSWGVRFKNRKIFLCHKCTLQFSNLISENQDIGMYDELYHSLMTGSSFDKAIDESGIKSQSLDRIRIVKKIKVKGDLLDIGCSTGEFLEAAKKEQYNIFGVDISEYACAKARENLKVSTETIDNSSIEDSEFLFKKKFDVITMWDVIEHCTNIANDMHQILGALRKDGLLLIRTPDSRSIFFLAAVALYKISGGRINGPCISLYHSDHFVFFNKKSLSLYLQNHGMKVDSLLSDPLTWTRFRYCECRRGILTNIGISFFYWVGRLFGKGHGLIAVALKGDGR